MRSDPVPVLVKEAVQDYLDAAAITDLDDLETAETQVALLGELREIPGWNGGGE